MYEESSEEALDYEDDEQLMTTDLRRLKNANPDCKIIKGSEHLKTLNLSPEFVPNTSLFAVVRELTARNVWRVKKFVCLHDDCFKEV